MKENYFSNKMKDKSDTDLKFYIENEDKFQEEAVIAARIELNNRKSILDKSISDDCENNKTDKHPKSFEHNEPIPLVIETDEFIDSNESNEFPLKPQEEEIKKQSINRSLISMGLFIAVFYFIFKWDLSYILVLTAVVFIHEIGHFLAMRIFKYKDLGIFFIPLVGAFASGSKDTVSQKQNVIILLAGPLPGIIIGVILYYYGLRDENTFLLKTSNIFIFLNLFNLLPFMPLDGGRLIKSMFFENNETISKVFIFISIAALSYYAIASQSYFLFIVPFFLLMQLSSLSEIKKVKKAILQIPIDINKSYSELSNKEYWLIRDTIGHQMKAFSRSITPKRYLIADNEQKIITQIKNILQKNTQKDLKIFGKLLITLLWISSFIIPGIIIIIYYIRLGIEIQ